MNQYGAGTNVGNVRDNNEDSYVCDEQKELWIVADGMGGLGFGEVASAISTYTVTRLIRDGHGVNQAIEEAHRKIKEYSETDGMGTNMGTTIVLLLSSGSIYNVFWVGDSRAYLYEEERLKQITVDHSLVQSLIEQGELTEAEAASDPRKNAITLALGVQERETVRADSVSEKWRHGQKILLCSDGLTDCVTNKDIESIIGQGGPDQEIVDRLIAAALEGGGHDNITVIIVSAPAVIKHADSDTHVPSGMDDTIVPNDDTQRKERPDQENGLAANLNTQLQLDIPHKTATPMTNPTEPAPQKNQHFWPLLLGTAATVAMVVVFGPTEENLPPPTPDAFIQTNTSSHPPPGRILPKIDLPEPDTIIQVGVFSGLSGAEKRLELISHLGFTPYIQKKTTQDGMFYAVLIGPIQDERHAMVVAALKENDINFFHWKDT